MQRMTETQALLLAMMRRGARVVSNASSRFFVAHRAGGLQPSLAGNEQATGAGSHAGRVATAWIGAAHGAGESGHPRTDRKERTWN